MKIYKLIYSNKKEEKFFKDLPQNIYEKFFKEEEEGFKKSVKLFVEKSKNRYKIIYKHKIYPLQSVFKFIKNKNENIMIKLICYNHNSDINKIKKDFQTNIDVEIEEIEKIKKNMNMYNIIDYLFYTSNEIQKLIYKIGDEDTIKIFGEQFVSNNKNKCSIIYKDKIMPLQSYFLFKDINKEDKENKKIEILLLELEDISDRSYMFYHCKSLVEFCHFDHIKNEMKDNRMEKEKYLNSQSTNYYKIFYTNEIDEDIIEKNDTYSTKEKIKSILSELNKIDKTKRSCYACLKNMSYMFFRCESLITLSEISKWNTIKVKNMNSMFYLCESLISLPDISKWNTNNVNDMSLIFYGCSSLKSLPDISKWNTIEVNDISSMFSMCSSLISLPDISKWNTNNVNNMHGILFGCFSLKSLPDISKWNTNNVNDMCSMFQECCSLISLPDISKWHTKNVKNMRAMFQECSSLISLPDISKWNTNRVVDMFFMFSGCSSLISLPDISNWITDNVMFMDQMFSQCLSLISLPDISKWNVKNLKTISNIFLNCYSLISLPDVSKWYTNNINDKDNSLN